MSSYWSKRRRVVNNVSKQLDRIEFENSNKQEPPPTENLLPHADGIASFVKLNNYADSGACNLEIDPEKIDINEIKYSHTVQGDKLVSRDNEIDHDRFSSDSDVEDQHCLPLEQTENSWTFDDTQSLHKWAIKFNVSHSCLSGLLEVLKNKFPELPKDPRTLLQTVKTDQTRPDIKCISSGSYYHFGLKEGILTSLTENCILSEGRNDVIELNINVDGVPLFKSSNAQFWPILGLVYYRGVCYDPFIVGIFYGMSKPSNLDFLTDFVAELDSIHVGQGIIHKDRVYSVKVRALVCDAPARAFLKNVKGHSGYHGCERCNQIGVWAGKMTFPETNASLRTDIRFDEMLEEGHQSLNTKSPLAKVGIGMVSNFVLDYMHLVCLGVTRRLIFLWKKGPFSSRLSAQNLKVISDDLVSLVDFIPREFARKPRSLEEVNRWKATEFRLFLLYTGPVVLVKHLSNEAYKNFMLLSVGIYIILHWELCYKYNGYANKLLVLFVQHFSDLYGADNLVYNVHNLIHLAQDGKKYGPLDSVSAFPFENFLGSLVKLIRKPSNPLEQVVRRVLEKKKIPTGSHEGCSTGIGCTFRSFGEHQSGPVPAAVLRCVSSGYKQLRRIQLQLYSVSVSQGDNCFCSTAGQVVIRNIISDNSAIFLVYQKFGTSTDFFTYPVESSVFGIHLVGHLSDTLNVMSLSEIKWKNVMLPYKSSHVVIPFLHAAPINLEFKN